MRDTSPEDLSRRLGGFAGRLQKLQRDAVGRAALVMKTAILAEDVRAVGSDLRLSGVGKRGAKIGVGYTVRGYENATALVAARGPAHLVERDTKPHRIPKQRGRGRRRFIVIPNVGVRAYANHPGTKGKHPFERGAERGRRPAVAAFATAIARDLRKTFG